MKTAGRVATAEKSKAVAKLAARLTEDEAGAIISHRRLREKRRRLADVMREAGSHALERQI